VHACHSIPQSFPTRRSSDLRWIYDRLLDTGMGEYMATILNLGILLVITLLIAFIMDWVLWKLFRYITVRVARKSRNNFDNFLVSDRKSTRLHSSHVRISYAV